MQLSTINSQPTMSSREIAELTDKEHRNVMRDIRSMLVELHGEGGVLSFEHTHTNLQNGQTYPVFMLPKRETLILVSGYSIELRAKIIDRWQELEAQQAPAMPLTYIQALERLIETEKQKEAALLALNVAVATKAEIGSRREATSMATASVAVRQRDKALEQLGTAKSTATIRAVNKATGESFQFKPLRDYCKAHELEPGYATDPLYGEVRTYPAIAWKDVYGIDLDKLFH